MLRSDSIDNIITTIKPNSSEQLIEINLKYPRSLNLHIAIRSKQNGRRVKPHLSQALIVRGQAPSARHPYQLS